MKHRSVLFEKALERYCSFVRKGINNCSDIAEIRDIIDGLNPNLFDEFQEYVRLQRLKDPVYKPSIRTCYYWIAENFDIEDVRDFLKSGHDYEEYYTKDGDEIPQDNYE